MGLYASGHPSFQDFLDREKRTQYIENPRKLANFDCCAAIFKTMVQEYKEIKMGVHSVDGGMEFVLHLDTVPLPSCFNVLLAELISRCHQLSVSPDPENPPIVLLSLTFYTCDRIVDGRLKRDY